MLGGVEILIDGGFDLLQVANSAYAKYAAEAAVGQREWHRMFRQPSGSHEWG